MGRLRWPPEDQAWLDTHPHGLPPDSPYRPAYRQKILGGSKTYTKVPEPWKALSKEDVDAWRARNLAERWATSDKTAAALAWLEQEFAGFHDPEGV